MLTTLWDRLSAIVVALEGLGLAVLVGWEVVALVTGDTGIVSTALALLVLSAVFAAAVIAFAVGLWRGLSWGRSGGIVTQLLILAVALGAATGQYAEPVTALWLAVPAVITLTLLIFAVRASGRSARE
ncbi:histidine kinase [Microbacterium sp. C7(2022)]|uniref:histidine kinase n=1 Tax=Microbacterium sp. C7(2022) TaxID=2992759 RepID=UPI00237A3F7E|nr:histidine kinase [Microbacterium sp. C7(2022)]MDE0547282.1 histidine kinase [Microbacterium sp. C7(2022)]